MDLVLHCVNILNYALIMITDLNQYKLKFLKNAMINFMLYVLKIET